MAGTRIAYSKTVRLPGLEMTGGAASRVRPLSLIYIAALVLFLSIFDRYVISGIPTMRTLSGVTGVVLALGWAIHRLPRFRFRRGPETWLIVFLFSLFMIDLGRYLVTGNFPLRNFLQWFQGLAFAIILFDLGRDPRAIRVYGAAIFLAVTFLTVSSFVNPQTLGGRTGAAELNLNTQAYFYAIAWVTCLAFLLHRWPRFKPNDFVVVLLALLFVFAQLRTGSRGAMLASAVGSMMLLVFMIRRQNLSAYLSLLPIMIGVVAIYLVFGSLSILDRFESTLTSGDLGYRDVIFNSAKGLIQQNPVFGAGPDFVEHLGVLTRGRDTSTHNTYLQVTTAYGAAGLTLFLTVVLATLKSCWRQRRSDIGALLTSLVVLSIFHGITADLAFNRYFWAVMALASGLSVPKRSLPG